jgi:hypothetical protein
VAVSDATTATDALDTLRERGLEVSDTHPVFVVDTEERLAGRLGIVRLVLARRKTMRPHPAPTMCQCADQGVHGPFASVHDGLAGKHTHAPSLLAKSEIRPSISAVLRSLSAIIAPSASFHRLPDSVPRQPGHQCLGRTLWSEQRARQDLTGIPHFNSRQRFSTPLAAQLPRHCAGAADLPGVD